MHNLKQNIFQTIESKRIKPKPRWLFVFKSLGAMAAMLFVFAFLFYIIAFLGFVISEHNWVNQETFTMSGMYFLLNTLPLSLMAVAAAMIMTASFVAYRYGLTYKKPFVWTVFGIILVLLLSHQIFTRTGLRDLIKQKAFENKVHLVPDPFNEIRSVIKIERGEI